MQRGRKEGHICNGMNNLAGSRAQKLRIGEFQWVPKEWEGKGFKYLLNSYNMIVAFHTSSHSVFIMTL